jgi:hypothetical protein
MNAAISTRFLVTLFLPSFFVVACSVTTGPASGSGSGNCFTFQQGKKGSQAKGAAAVAAKQRSSEVIPSGTAKGPSYQGATCDSSADGVAWCDGDHSIAMCDGSQWQVKDCGSDTCVTFNESHDVGCTPSACAQ